MVNESRIFKIAKTLEKQKYFNEIQLVGVCTDGLPEVEVYSEKTKIIRLKKIWGAPHSSTLKKTMGILLWYFNCSTYLRSKKIACINAHSLSTLPLCVFVKWAKGARLIYDTHEHETETTSSKGIRKWVSKIIESFFIRFCDQVIVVSPSIEKAYVEDYNLSNITTVLNAPVFEESVETYDIFRTYFELEKDDIIYLYQGGLFKNRSIELLLDTFSRITNPRKHIVFLGYGELELLVKDYERQYKNIHFHIAVKPSQLHMYTSSADVGFCLIENSCLSYYYSLPNKLFEYMHSGLDIIGSDFPEIARILREIGYGATLSKNHEFFDLVNEHVFIKRKSNREVCKKYSWQSQEKLLQGVYKKLSF